MNERKLQSFLKGYDEAKAEYEDWSAEQIKDELVEQGRSFLENTGFEILIPLYTSDKLAQIGLIDRRVCAESERGSFSKAYMDKSEEWAYITGLDIGSFEHLTRRAHEVLDRDFIAGARHESFPEIFNPKEEK